MDDLTPSLIPVDTPGYLFFATEAEALAAEADISVAMGYALVGVNAATGQPDPSAQVTTRWAVPVRAEGGKWAIPAPQNPTKLGETATPSPFIG